MGNRVVKLKKEDCVLVGIDFQEKILPAMKDKEEIESAMVKLVKGCRIFNVPIIMTQQYTKGLGATVPSIDKAIKEALGDEIPETNFEPIEKTSFSAMEEPVFVEALKRSGKKTVVVTGIEAHVCVQQTVIDLLESGYTVFVANDCISSRTGKDKKCAQRRMENAGAIGSTYEAVLFELCGGAGRPGFKQISALVK